MAAVIQLLGRPGIHRPTGRGFRPRGRKTRALLALASLSERPVPRHQLVRMLFPRPSICRWIDVATRDAICEVTTAHEMPRAPAAVAELAGLGEYTKMPEYAARARTYRARLGVRGTRRRTPARSGSPDRERYQ